MPAAIFAVAAAVAGGAAAAAVGGGILGAVIGGVVTAGLGLLGSAIFPAPKPKAREINLPGGGRTEMVREPIRAHAILYGRVRVSGTIVFLHTKTDNLGRPDGFLYMAVVLAGHQIDAVEEIFLDNVPLTDPKFAGIARVTPWLGSETQIADPDWLAEIPERWTADHRLRGRAWLACRFRWDASAFRTGVPKVTAVVRGRQVFDPRTGRVAWSANSALCAADWLTTYRGIPRERINLVDWIAAANICDEPVPLRAGGSERRYETHGTLATDDDPRAVLPKLAAPMAGAIVNSAGLWSIFAGAWSEPVQTLTINDLRADVTLNTRRQRRDLFNGVRATFINPRADWQPVDAPPLRDARFLAEDGGVEQDSVLEMPFTTSSAAVQRLMAIALERNRRQRSVRFPAKLSALALRPWDVVAVDLGRLGSFTGRITSWSFSADGGIDLVVEEEDAACWAWDASREVPMADAPEVSFGGLLVPAPSELNISTPTAPVFTSLSLSWAQVTAVTVQDYEVQHRAAGGGEWTSTIRTVTNATLTVAGPSAIRVRARETPEKASAWKNAVLPGAPFGISQAQISVAGAVRLNFTKDAQAATTQVFSSAGTDPTVATLTAVVTGSSVTIENVGQNVTRRFWLRSVAADGNVSALSAMVTGVGEPAPYVPPDYGPTCFPPQTPVLRADGTWVRIDAVKPGDRLRGGRGEVNTVIALDRSLLTERPLWLINGHHRTTAEHRHLTTRGWASLDPVATHAEHLQFYPVILGDGSVVKRQLVKFTRTPVHRLQLGDVLIRADGTEEPIVTLEAEWHHDPMTVVHSLVMDGSHTFIASGFVVSGWARDDDFDYDSWTLRNSEENDACL